MSLGEFTYNVVDDPDSPERKRKYGPQARAIAETIKSQPGMWFHIASYPDDPYEAHLQRYRLTGYPNAPLVRGLEFAVRKPDLFARYIPPADETVGQEGGTA